MTKNTTSPSKTAGTMKSTEGSKRITRSNKKAAKAPTEAEVDIAALAKKSTIADQLDLMAYKDKAPLSSEAEREEIAAAVARGEQAFAAVERQDRNSRAARARSYAETLCLVQHLCTRPTIIWALTNVNEGTITERTAKSPCLAAIKALFPGLDRREQSAVAAVHNHAFANEWGPEELERQIKAVGTVELIKRERQRQRLRAGAPEAPSIEEIVAGYRGQTDASPLCDVCAPKEDPGVGLALLLVGVVGGELVAYDIDLDEKRVVAAVKSCAKRGRELRTKSVTGGVAEAAE